MKKGNAIGIDISSVEGKLDLAQFWGAPFSFAFVRASFGVTADRMFPTHWSRARENGWKRGAYHVGTDADPIAQADLFLREVAPGPDDVLALDFETGHSHAMTAENAVKFVERIHERNGSYPILYTSVRVIQSLPENQKKYVTQLALCPLWISQSTPTIDETTLPPQWPSWLFRQVALDVDVGPGTVSIDVFAHGIEEKDPAAAAGAPLP